MVPAKLESMVLRMSSGVVVSSMRCADEWPALFTSTSTRPQVSSTSAAMRRTAAWSATSRLSASAVPPCRSISPRTAVSLLSVRPTTATRAPCTAISSAAARPIPLPPPVTMQTLSAKPMPATYHRAVTPSSPPTPTRFGDVFHGELPHAVKREAGLDRSRAVRRFYWDYVLNQHS